jgi:hypothetical protein
MGDHHHPLMLFTEQALTLHSPTTSDLPTFSRRKVFSRRVQTFLIILLSGFLIWEHLGRSHTCPNPNLSHLVEGNDISDELQLSPVDTLALRSKYNDITASYNLAMSNGTSSTDFAGFADHVKVLFDLQQLSDELDAMNATRTLEDDAQQWTDRLHMLQANEAELIQKLFPFINMNKTRKRTLDELQSSFRHEKGIVIPVGNGQFQMGK